MINFNLVNTYYPETSGIQCADEKCGRFVGYLEKCFIDTLKDCIYCEACGQCVRYERKMADKRQSLKI